MVYTEERPWGSFTVLDEGRSYKVKRITVNAKKRLSLQEHKHRCEYWIIVDGDAVITIGDNQYLVKTGEMRFIPARTKHRLSNPGDKPLKVIEIQIGEYLGEDDIIRYEDDFGRV